MSSPKLDYKSAQSMKDWASEHMMAKQFSTPVDRTGDDKAESKRVNEMIRSGRGRSVTLPITGDKVAKGMGNFIRASAGRGVSDPVVAAALAK